MYLSNLIIKNFRNFRSIDIPLSGNIVLLGENSVGKSNLLYAIRLVLDPTLPDSARQLKLTDFWDGCNPCCSPIEVHLDFVQFDTDYDLCALLTDFRLPWQPRTARLSFVYRKKYDVDVPRSSEDFEFIVFGGMDETRSIPSKVRRRVSIDILDALRNAEGQLASWRNSPLRPLLEDAMSSISPNTLVDVAGSLQSATQILEKAPSVYKLETSLRQGIYNLAGSAHDIDARLRFAPADPQRLFRAISMFIDGGRRTISEASLGDANVALIALKLAEFS